MNFELEIKARQKNIDKILEKYLPEEKGYQKTVMEAMRYSLMAEENA